MVQELNHDLDWSDLKGMVRQRWTKLSEDDVSKLDGSEEELIATLRRCYGYGEAQAEIEINLWLQDIYSHNTHV